MNGGLAVMAAAEVQSNKSRMSTYKAPWWYSKYQLYEQKTMSRSMADAYNDGPYHSSVINVTKDKN